MPSLCCLQTPEGSRKSCRLCPAPLCCCGAGETPREDGRRPGLLVSWLPAPSFPCPFLPQLWGLHYVDCFHSSDPAWVLTGSCPECRHMERPPGLPGAQAGPSGMGCASPRPWMGGCPGRTGRWGAEPCVCRTDPSLNPGAGWRATFRAICPVHLLPSLGKGGVQPAGRQALQAPLFL